MQASNQKTYEFYTYDGVGRDVIIHIKACSGGEAFEKFNQAHGTEYTVDQIIVKRTAGNATQNFIQKEFDTVEAGADRTYKPTIVVGHGCFKSKTIDITWEQFNYIKQYLYESSAIIAC